MSESKLRSSPIAMTVIALSAIFVLYQLIGGGIAFVVFGSPSKGNVFGFRLATMIAQFVFILVPTVAFARWQGADLRKVFRLNLPDIAQVVLAVVGVVSLQQIAQIYIYVQDALLPIEKLSPIFDVLRKMMEESYARLVEAKTPLEYAFVVLVVALTPSICEEALFRGLVQYNLEVAGGAKIGYIVSGIAFAVYHTNPFSFIPLVALGIYFGYLVYRSNSIFLGMVAHFVNNFTATYAYYRFGKESFIGSPEKMSLSFTVAVGVLALLVFIGSIYLLENLYKKEVVEK